MTISFRERVKNRDLLVGTLLTLPSPEIAEILVHAGFDWLFIDSEHAPLTRAHIQQLLQATGDCPCLVRVADKSETAVKGALDSGANGIIAPQVNTAAAAERIVKLCKYPPLGYRSVGVARAHGYGMTFQSYLERANDQTVVVAQIEHITGVENIEAIVQVDGIDAIFLGPYDLSASMGIPGKVGDTAVLSAIEHVCTVATNAVGIDTDYLGQATTAAYQHVKQLNANLE